MSDFGAEDEALYSSSKDDKPKGAENTGSAAGSVGFCYPKLAVFLVFTAVDQLGESTGCKAALRLLLQSYLTP